MQFSKLNLTVGTSPVSFLPYDRGTNGAFVYRQEGMSLYAPRTVVSTTVNDAGSDKLVVQNNHPRVDLGTASLSDDVILGTDLTKTEMRFLASTSKSDRVHQIDVHIALLEELRQLVQDREVIYS